MFKDFLLSAFRNLRRNKVYSLINIASLAIGLTVSAFALLYVKKELSYDQAWPEAERIHRLVLEQKGIPGRPDGLFSSVLSRAYPRIQEYFEEEIDKSSRVFMTYVSVANEGDDSNASTTNNTNLAFVDEQFLDIFKLDVVSGNLRNVFAAPGLIALEEKYASTLSESSMIGERITLETSYSGQAEYEVGAIYRLPENISTVVNFTTLTLIHDYSLSLFDSPNPNIIYSSWENSVQIWLTLKSGVELETFDALQPGFVQSEVRAYDEVLGEGRKISDHLFYRWQPITEMHFNPAGFESVGLGTGDKNRVITFAIVGLLVLLVGCSNSVSLSLAGAMERKKEIGIRKAAGALPGDITRQYLGEAVLLALLALVPTIAMIELAQPYFFRLLSATFSISPIETGLKEYCLIGAVAVFVGLASGLYPALLLAAVRPQSVLKENNSSGLRSKQGIRSLLVSAQFCFATMLLICTASLYAQLEFSRSQPIGFDVENLILVSLGGGQTANGSAMQQELLKTPGILKIATSFNIPNANLPANFNSTNLVLRQGDLAEVKAQSMFVESGEYFDLLDMQVIAGRGLNILLDTREQNESGVSQGDARIMLNRTAIRALGFDSPEVAVDKVIYRRFTNNESGELFETPLLIVGVLEDNMFGSLSRRPGPEIYQLVRQGQGGSFFLKYDSSIEETIKDKIQEVSIKINGQTLQTIIFIEDRLKTAFIEEKNESLLLLICGALTLFLACTGLYGLAAFSMERNLKEVGVRKVLGASVFSIMVIFLWRFSKSILVASAVACPIAVYFVSQRIQSFPYQIDKAWLVPLSFAVIATVLFIAWLTVGVITAKAARAKPVLALRCE